jgi:hypothetical protein
MRKIEIEYLILRQGIKKDNNLYERRAYSFSIAPKANFVEQLVKKLIVKEKSIAKKCSRKKIYLQYDRAPS